MKEVEASLADPEYVSMESGLEDRNNIVSRSCAKPLALSQWSPA